MSTKQERDDARGKRIDGVVASIMAYHRAFSEYGKAQEKVEVWAV